MDFKYQLPETVEYFIKDAIISEINIGCSDSRVFKIIKDDLILFLKLAEVGLLEKEYNSLKWLEEKLPVPKIIHYYKSDEAEFLITSAIPGEMVCSAKYVNNPDLALDIIAEAFNQIYKINIDDCPLNVSNVYKLDLINHNVENDLVSAENFNEETLKSFTTIESLLEYLKDNTFEEELVFSHGDTSLPNIFADNDKFSGFIDVGECGIADKWFDLALCEKSIVRNFGEEYVDKFYEKLNIIPNRNKIDYYLLMMELYL